jgi:hypothetical protein
MKATLIGVVAIFAFGGCQSPASIERRLIGKWAAPTPRIAPGRDDYGNRNMVNDVMEITFTDDHREIWRYRGAKLHASARWHLEGSDLVFTLKTPVRGAPAGTIRRERIKRVTSTELVFTDGSHDTVWTRAR